ncbi:MAG: hypothetical protein WC340_13790 [Kiritimatiellia bacterium]
MKEHVFSAVTASLITFALQGGEERTTFSTLYDGVSHGRIEAFVAEKDGSGWAKNHKELLFFKDGKLQCLTGAPVEGYTYDQVFLGDAEHGYYSPRGDTAKKQKLIYRLIDGEARLHCPPLPIDSNSNEIIRDTYVAQDGRVLSWNTDRIALWQNGAWAMKPASMPTVFGLPIVLEHEGNLVLVGAQQLHVIDPSGELTTLKMAWKQPTSRCVRWRGRTALRISEGAKVVEAFDLLSGELLPLPLELKRVTGPLTDLAVGSNGQLLIRSESAIFNLAPDNTLSTPSVTMPELLDVMADWNNPFHLPRLSADGEGGLWFSGTMPGLWHLSEQGLKHWDWRHGIGGGIRDICYVSGQSLLFLLGSQILQARLGELPPAELAGIRADRWTTYRKRRGTTLYEAGGGIAFLPAEKNIVMRWDGNRFSEQELPPELAGDNAFTFSDDRGVLYIQTEPPPSKPYGFKAAITPNGVHILSRPSQTTSVFQMEEALEWGVREGATGFECQDMHFLVTPEKHIYVCRPHTSSVVRFFNGTSWSTLRPAGTAIGFAYLPRYGALVRLRDGDFLRYQTGVLEPVALETALLMQDGLSRCPFDRALMTAQPDRHLLIAPYSLPSADGRAADRDSARFAQVFMLPGLTTSSLGVNVEQAHEKSLMKFQQYKDIRAHYPLSGGCFLKEHYDPPIRIFGGIRVPVILENTPLLGRLIGNTREDANGNIWFDFREDGRVVCCYRTDDLRVTAQVEPGGQERDRVIVRAGVQPPVKSVRFFYRLSQRDTWQPFSGETTETLYFPESGTYTCEVVALHMGARLKHIGVLQYEARVALPDTRLTDASGSANVITVKTLEWQPPVACVPVAPERSDACTLVWRREESCEPWQPLSKDGGFPLHCLGTNGLYQLLFAAVEEGFRRDVTPERLIVRLDLPDEEQLLTLIENLTGNDFIARDAAYIHLMNDRPKWLAVLHKLETQSSAAQHLLKSLAPVSSLLRAQ